MTNVNKNLPTAIPFRQIRQSIQASLSFRYGFLVALSVWTAWLVAVGPMRAIANALANWEMAVTMIFGSMVAGSTSLGGGAVAFPVLTKVLHVPASETAIFSLAIQSVGMGAATVTIIAMRVPVEWRAVRWATLGGIPGILLSTAVIDPLLAPELTRLSFTAIIGSFAIVLRKSQKLDRQLWIPVFGNRERAILLAVGLAGGVLSGLVGSGIDILVFSTLVLLFRLNETVATPTSVVAMAFNAMIGFAAHYLVLGTFTEPVVNYWLAAVPIVVIGAPLGAAICSIMNRRLIVGTLLGLIAAEVSTSVLLIDLTPLTVGYTIAMSCAVYGLYHWMFHIKSYEIRVTRLR